MQFYLIVARGKHRGMPIAVDLDRFVIGSAPSCQLRTQHPAVGPQHCALVTRGNKVFVCDLGSGLPTLVNGEELPASAEWPVHKGDMLVVGPLAFKLSFREKPLSGKDLEEWAVRTLDEDTGPKVAALQEHEEAMGEPNRVHDEAAEAAAAILNRLTAQKGIVWGRLRFGQEGGITVVRVDEHYLVEPPELAQLKKEVQDNLDQPNLRVLLDLKHLRRMSTEAARLFGEIATWLRQRGGSLAVCRLRPELAAMLRDSSRVFNFRVFPDKAVALSAKW